jgi:hypothetical protein
LNKKTRSERNPWTWTKLNEGRANDLLAIFNDMRKWWPLTARQAYYRLISSERINQSHWFKHGNLSKERVDVYPAIIRTLKWMRIDERLPWNAITDEHRITTAKVGFSDKEDFISQEMDVFLTGYRKCRAQKQKYYIEVWIEKAALLHIIKPISDYFCRRTVACKGYNSITFQSEFYNRVQEALGYDQQTIVLYFGDWDPSGVNMIYAAMQTLYEELGLFGVNFYHCGINPEHFNQITANPVPIKKTDSRSKRFIEQHGTTAYELDAFHPEQLQVLVREAIEQFTDLDVLEDDLEQEDEDQSDLEILRDDVVQMVEKRGL